MYIYIYKTINGEKVEKVNLFYLTFITFILTIYKIKKYLKSGFTLNPLQEFFSNVKFL